MKIFRQIHRALRQGTLNRSTVREAKTNQPHRVRLVFCALLAAALSFAMLPAASQTAQAAALPTATKPASASTAALPSFVVNGTRADTTVVGFDGREWFVIGANGNGVAGKAGVLTLLQRTVPTTETTVFSTSNNEYATSTLYQKMLERYSYAPGYEQELVMARDLPGGGALLDPDKIAGATVIGTKYWPLSYAEALDMNSELRWINRWWWLRTPGDGPKKVANVSDNGYLQPNGSDGTTMSDSPRPAFHLNLTPIFLATNASGDGAKSAVTVWDGTAPTKSDAQKLKLTAIVSDTNFLALQCFDKNTRMANPGDTISISWSGAKTTGTDKYVSCVIVDSSGAAKYYAKLSRQQGGTASLNIPSGIAAGYYTIKVFNEQENGENNVDFASAPESIPLIVVPEAGSVPSFVTPSDLPSGQIGVPYNQTLVTTGAPPIKYTLEGGSLPDGLSLSTDGMVTGTPTAVGKYQFTVEARNTSGYAMKLFFITVSNVPPGGGGNGGGSGDGGTTPGGVGSGNDNGGGSGGGGNGGTGGGNNFDTPSNGAIVDVNVTKVRTPLATVYLKKGKALTLPVAFDGKDANGKDIASAKLTWKSSKPKVAAVSANGKVTPKKVGTAKITATAMNGKKLSVTVKVVAKAKALKSLALKKPPKKMKPGKTAILKLKLAPLTATNLKIKFKSNKVNVIRVDRAGKLTALKKGKAKITVTVGKKKWTQTIVVK